MGLLDTIKSLLGMDDSSEKRGRRDTNVTVERDTRTEPSSKSEAAVKGTEDDEIAAEAESDADADGPDETGSTARSDDGAAAAEAGADASETGTTAAETGSDATAAEAGSDGVEADATATDATAAETGAGATETDTASSDAVAAETGADVEKTTAAESADRSDSGAQSESADDAEADSVGGEASETADAAEADEFTSEAAMESVKNIKGIGPAYAERLSEAGVDSVADLATADANELADAIDVSEKRIGRWIERARDYANE